MIWRSDKFLTQLGSKIWALNRPVVILAPLDFAVSKLNKEYLSLQWQYISQYYRNSNLLACQCFRATYCPHLEWPLHSCMYRSLKMGAISYQQKYLTLIFFCLFAGWGEHHVKQGWLQTGEDIHRCSRKVARFEIHTFTSVLSQYIQNLIVGRKCNYYKLLYDYFFKQFIILKAYRRVHLHECIRRELNLPAAHPSV
jgi:hypothetical protein